MEKIVINIADRHEEWTSTEIWPKITRKFKKFKIFVERIWSCKIKLLWIGPTPIERHLLKIIGKCTKRFFGLNHISDIYWDWILLFQFILSEFLYFGIVAAFSSVDDSDCESSISLSAFYVKTNDFVLIFFCDDDDDVDWNFYFYFCFDLGFCPYFGFYFFY